MAERKKILILGAAGRDFHDFNMIYRDDPGFEVVAFTAAQIPDIAGRHYPPELAGPLYPTGIPILEESGLERLIEEASVDTVIFAYSDVSQQQVMHLAARVLACSADFQLLGPKRIMLQAEGLLLLTYVDAVYLDWNTPAAQPLGLVSAQQLRSHSFAPGSMGPKVEAVCRFIEQGGSWAGIGSLETASDILQGTTGTRINS